MYPSIGMPLRGIPLLVGGASPPNPPGLTLRAGLTLNHPWLHYMKKIAEQMTLAHVAAWLTFRCATPIFTGT